MTVNVDGRLWDVPRGAAFLEFTSNFHVPDAGKPKGRLRAYDNQGRELELRPHEPACLPEIPWIKALELAS